VKDNLQTLLFAVVLGFVCSLLLATAGQFTAPYRQANEKAEEVRNFLSALQVPFDPEADPRALVDIFDRNIRVSQHDGLTLYEYTLEHTPESKAEAVAVPFSGPGLWGPIEGVMALEPDLATIRAVRFYKQEETPGLGGEIGADWFQDKFAGKKMVSRSGDPVFRVRPGAGAEDQNGVDAITGATMTSDRVQDILNDLARRLHNERERQ